MKHCAVCSVLHLPATACALPSCVAHLTAFYFRVGMVERCPWHSWEGVPVEESVTSLSKKLLCAFHSASEKLGHCLHISHGTQFTKTPLRLGSSAF